MILEYFRAGAEGEIALNFGDGVAFPYPIGDIMYCVNFDSGCRLLVKQTRSSSSTLVNDRFVTFLYDSIQVMNFLSVLSFEQS